MIRRTMAETLRLSPFLGYDMYVFNTTRPPFDDPRVRRALSMAIDRDMITGKIQTAGDRPAFGYVVPETSNYPRAVQADFLKRPMEERQKQARQMLSEAGFTSSQPLKFNLSYNTREDIKRVAVAVAAMWRQIGVVAELENSEARVHRSRLISGDFAVARWLQTSDADDPSGFLKTLVSDAGAGVNLSRYANPAFDALVAKSNQALDPAERAALLQQAEEIALADHPIAPIYNIVSKKLVAKRVAGWVENPREVHPMRFVSVRSENQPQSTAP